MFSSKPLTHLATVDKNGLVKKRSSTFNGGFVIVYKLINSSDYETSGKDGIFGLFNRYLLLTDTKPNILSLFREHCLANEKCQSIFKLISIFDKRWIFDMLTISGHCRNFNNCLLTAN